VAKVAGRDVTAAVLVIGLLAVVIWRIRRGRAERREPEERTGPAERTEPTAPAGD
jgi:hypothetical protein